MNFSVNNATEPRDDFDSGWLEHSETLDEMKEESGEIKEEPFDDMADIKPEDLLYYSSANVTNETAEFKEDLEIFDDIKQEDPLVNDFNVIKDESVEMKEEPIDDFDDIKEEPVFDAYNAIAETSMEIKEEPIGCFVGIKEEELSVFPIADVFCPSTGDCRPLTIDLDDRNNSKSQIVSSRPITKTTHPTNEKEPNLGDAMKRGNLSSVPKMDTLEATADPIALKRARVVQSGYSKVADCSTCKALPTNSHALATHIRMMHPERKITKCGICNALHNVGSEMESHMRSMHPEESLKILEQILRKKCAFCHSVQMVGDAMDRHVRLMHPHARERVIKQCAYCNENHAMGVEMEKHVRSMHPEAFERRVISGAPNIPKRLAPSPKIQFKHLKLTKCCICNAFHNVGSEMESHMRSMHPEESKKILEKMLLKKCAFCNSFKMVGDAMDQHVRSMHPYARERMCAFCSSVHEIGPAMNNHVQLMHPERLEKIKSTWGGATPQPHPPPIPPTVNTLIFRSCKCAYCGFHFSGSAQMEKHVQLMHTEVSKQEDFLLTPLESNVNRFNGGIRPVKILPTDKADKD